MLMLVISRPVPTKPSLVKEHRQAYWEWIARQVNQGFVKDMYGIVGRGMVVVFNVDSNQTLNHLLNEWMEIVPAEFDIIPIIDPKGMRAFLSDGDSTSVSSD